MREPLTPPLMRSNVFTHIGRKVQAPRPSLSLAGSTCTSIHEVELGQCSRFAKRPFAKGPFGKRTAFCAAAVSARQPKAQNAYSPNQPRTTLAILLSIVHWHSSQYASLAHILYTHYTVLSWRFKNMSFSSKAIQNPSKNCEMLLEIFDSRSHYLLYLFARLVAQRDF